MNDSKISSMSSSQDTYSGLNFMRDFILDNLGLAFKIKKQNKTFTFFLRITTEQQQ